MTCSRMFYSVVRFIKASRENACQVVGVSIKKRRFLKKHKREKRITGFIRNSSECASILSLESRMYG